MFAERILFLVLLVSATHASVIQRAPAAAEAGAMVSIRLGPGPAPHPVWSVGKCWRWNAFRAPWQLSMKLSASICRSFRVPKTATYHIIADTSTIAKSSDSLAVVRVMRGKKSLLWRYYYNNHEKSSHPPMQQKLWPSIDYTVCISGRQQTFNLCRLELYACQSDDICQLELSTHGLRSLSRRRGY